jgi:hypothetical protein
MIRNRILVMLLALWGLAMIVPDLVRVVQPLGSLGFYADNDGIIYSVSGPFEDRQSSPAWNAGIRPGDRLDLERASGLGVARTRRCHRVPHQPAA